MVSAVKSRPNHYEVLGLVPGASGDAIAAAFAQAASVFRPHAFGGLTEICLAYETLRDPVRRRTYDASLGLAPERPKPPTQRTISAHFMVRPAVAALPPEPKVERKTEPKSPEPAIRRPVPLDRPLTQQPAYGEINVELGPIEWKRTGAVVGGLLAAAVFVGAVAGWWSGSSAADPEQAAPVAAEAPEERAPPSFSELWPEPASHEAKVQPVQARRIASVRPRIKSATRRPQFAASEAESQLIQPPQDLAVSSPADPLAPEATPAPPVATQPAAAAMPLPHRTVARTIDRIGYACGSVASAVPVDGAAGVYKVSCTSGQSFQARPVNGRYRFRRLAKN